MELRYEEETKRQSWFSRLHLSWPMLFLAGWLLYELTAQPGLAALVFCAKFGWADALTAFWLRRVDPDQRRGQTCFWAYLTYGLWKVAMVATSLMATIGYITDLLGGIPRQAGARPQISPVLTGALTAAAVGFGLSSLTACITLWSARRNGGLLWLGHAPNWARKQRFWPPHHGHTNLVPFVVLTNIGLIGSFLFISAIVFVCHVQFDDLWLVALVLLLSLASIILLMILAFRPWLGVIAKSPDECWIAEEGEVLYQVQDTEASQNDP